MNGQEKSDNERTIIELRERARVRKLDIYTIYTIYIIYNIYTIYTIYIIYTIYTYTICILTP